MKKKLIYYFYLTDDFKENRANKINFRCLKRYANIFDEADIYISIDDDKNFALIKEAEKVFLGLPFNGNISFRVRINDSNYCEAEVIKSELLDKIDTLDCLVFFGHAKGYSNFKTYPENMEDIQKWIIGNYYLSLEHMDEVVESISENSYYSTSVFGSFPIVSNEKIKESDFSDWNKIFPGRIKYNWFYSGCFFWVNTMRLYNYINIFSPSMPKMCDRYFGERLLGNIFPYTRNATAHRNMYLYPCNFYNRGVISRSLGFILGEELEDFNKLYNEILEGL